MLLQNKALRAALIPLNSKCYINNRGLIKDGDIISVVSPIFSSINYSTKKIKLDDSFDVVFKTDNINGILIDDNNNEAFLNCKDQDILNMYVTIRIDD